MPPREPSPDADLAQQRDVAWMRRVQSGDTDALALLINEHKNRVAAGVARMAGPGFDAEEITHEVFVRVWKSAARYEPSARFTTWLFTIARNLVLNEIRYKTRHPTVSRDALAKEGGAMDECAHETGVRPDSALLASELEEAIDVALQALPENQRTAVVMRRYEELSYEEIASVLEVSVSSVKSLLFRARTTLRESLRQYLD
jgi:RNA polymerase sigma-70 factor (ECF subfamily)